MMPTTFNAAGPADPWSWTDGEGLYVSRFGQVWFYAVAPEVPYPDTCDRESPDPVVSALNEIAQPFRSGDWAWVGNRDVHVLRLTWDAPARTRSTATSPALSELFVTPLPCTFVAVGVRLTRMPKSHSALAGLFGPAEPSLGVAEYELDLDRARAAFAAHRFAPVDADTRPLLERWFQQADAQVPSGALRFTRIRVEDIEHPWVTDLVRHRNPPRVVSMRAELTAAVGPAEPTLVARSILVGHVPGDGDPTDALDGRLGVLTEALDGHLLAAVAETLPCSPWVVPDGSDPAPVRLSSVAASGISRIAVAGADAGYLAGLTLPDLQPVLWQPDSDDSNLTVIAGDRGTGRTFLAANLAAQAALDGHPTLYVTTGGLGNLAELAARVGGAVVPAATFSAPGSLDPYRWLGPDRAGDVLCDLAAALGADRTSVAATITALEASPGDLSAAAVLSALGASPDNPAADDADADDPVDTSDAQAARRDDAAHEHAESAPNAEQPAAGSGDDAADGGEGDDHNHEVRDRWSFDRALAPELIDALAGRPGDDDATSAGPDDLDAPFVVIDLTDIVALPGGAAVASLIVELVTAATLDDGGVVVIDELDLAAGTVADRDHVHHIVVTGTSTEQIGLVATPGATAFLLRSEDHTTDALAAIGLAATERRVAMVRSASPPHRPGDDTPTWALIRDQDHRIVPVVVGPAPEPVRGAFGIDDGPDEGPITLDEQLATLIELAGDRGLTDAARLLSRIVTDTSHPRR